MTPALPKPIADFPGNPLRFTYRFKMVDDAIKTLETTVWA